jgi:hypothetical protein
MTTVRLKLDSMAISFPLFSLLWCTMPEGEEYGVLCCHLDKRQASKQAGREKTEQRSMMRAQGAN